MGTRSGAVDPSVITYIMNKENMTPDEMATMLNKKSGFLGLSGISPDCREIEEAAAKGDHRAQLTLDIVTYQVKKQIAAYAAAMGGVDSILFTGGIGENSSNFRQRVCEGLEFMGVKIDADLNEKASRGENKFSTEDSNVQVWVLPTNEELLIARDTKEIVDNLNK